MSSWLAILVMALNALWPLIANARPAGAPGLMEICTADGVKSLDGGPAAPEDSASKHLQPHCPLCSFGSDKLAAAPAHAFNIAAADLPGVVLPDRAAAALPRHHLHSPAHPRAPPASL